jgi:uncharacterized membrane protein
MTLDPLRAASLLIQIHTFAALSAFALGIFQLAAPKGTTRHRITGWIWVGIFTLRSGRIMHDVVFGPEIELESR